MKTPFSRFHARVTEDYYQYRKGEGRAQFLSDPGREHAKVESVSVHFDEIERHICKEITMSTVAVGAISWLTNEQLLAALSRLERVAIVVQKEDFLRPDATVEKKSEYYARVREQYGKLPPLSFDDFRESYPGQQEDYAEYNSYIQDRLISSGGNYLMPADAVRCLGYVGGQRDPFIPRMHHKFVVLGDFLPDSIIRPRCVVTGSFNWTATAMHSRENIVVLRDERVCRDFVSEWAQLWSISEPLDWESPAPTFPHHFLGT